LARLKTFFFNVQPRTTPSKKANLIKKRHTFDQQIRSRYSSLKPKASSIRSLLCCRKRKWRPSLVGSKYDLSRTAQKSPNPACRKPRISSCYWLIFSALPFNNSPFPQLNLNIQRLQYAEHGPSSTIPTLFYVLVFKGSNSWSLKQEVEARNCMLQQSRLVLVKRGHGILASYLPKASNIKLLLVHFSAFPFQQPPFPTSQSLDNPLHNTQTSH
jgi:hypothetical protein